MMFTQRVVSILSLSFALLSCAGTKQESTPTPPTAQIEPDHSALPILSLSSSSVVETSISITQIGELKPPMIDGLPLQATDVVVRNEIAFVSYNLQGSKQRGALVSLSLKTPSKPKVISELLFKNSKINAVDADESEVFVVGSTEDESQGPAFMGRMKYKDGALLGEMKMRSVPGYAGTDIAVYRKIVMTASGDNAGVLGWNKESLEVIVKEPIFDARAIAISACGPWAYALKGQKAEVSIYKTDILENAEYPTFEMRSQIELGGANMSESKSNLQLGRRILLATQGEDGFSILCKEDGRVLSHNPVEPTDGVSTSELVTNAVAAQRGLVFAANGGAGLHIYEARSSTDDRICPEVKSRAVGRVGFGDFASANHVYATEKYVFVATGTGGLKILLFKRPETDADLQDFADTERCD